MLPGDVQWIRLRRDSLLAQAASFAKARQTRQFTSRTLGSPKFVGATFYDDGAMTSDLRRAKEAESAWNEYFSSNGIDPIDVWYEELDADTCGVVRDVATRLGFDPAAVILPDLVRTRDATNAEWIDRFCELHPDLAGPNRDGRPPGSPPGRPSE